MAEEKITRKITLSRSDWAGIDAAMEREGIGNPREYLLAMSKARDQTTDAERNRAAALKYKYSNLFTLYNKMESGVGGKETRVEFMKEAKALCQELLSR